MKRILFFLSIFLTFISSCQEDPLKLKSAKDFENTATKPLYEKYGNVSSLKVVFETKSKEVHYVNGKHYDYHYEYCMDVLAYSGNLRNFNNEMYADHPKREYLLGNINYYQDLDVYLLELGPSDRMNINQLSILYASIVKSSFIGNNLKVFSNNLHIQTILASTTELPTVHPEDIYKNQSYQNIHSGHTKGNLKIIRNWGEEKNTIEPTDIIVCDNIPLILPSVRGIIVTKMQTPLSHVSLLAKNRNIPVMVNINALEDSTLIALNNSPIELIVRHSSFEIKKTTGLGKIKTKTQSIKLYKTTSMDSLIGVEHIRERHSKIVGNKAANFGLLHQYSQKINFKTPECAFAIPFHFYEKHIEAITIQNIIHSLDDNQSKPEERLETIRNYILSQPVDRKLINAIKERLLKDTSFTKFRFRSSTNAEDRADFSGAGLYTSKTVDLNSSSRTIENAIRKVWASTWSDRAFSERTLYGIKHSTVAMGILVHRSFPTEEVNGVAITTNLYRDNYLGFVINCQLGDESVVEPKEGVQCDQLIIYPDQPNAKMGAIGNVDIITISNLNKGDLVMNRDELRTLAGILESIKRAYYYNHPTKVGYNNLGLDLEFKLDTKTRILYIKQLRIYRK